ncbi:hypothetical protein ACFU96_45405 [Streptomyces sp. NPDC057620]|uniref:hypothetical protein n=1 Tax=Streptomyces sp. NPDC057620 TaxID=3346185 RepID=UPI0036CA308A
MPDPLPTRHTEPQPNSHAPKFPPQPSMPVPRFALIVNRGEQEVRATGSRRLRRADDFLAAARYMIRFHPQAGATTLRLAAAFAARAHRNRNGHIAFNLKATTAELGVSRRTVLNHTRYLRELGLIAWVEHGSNRNALRARHGTAWQPGHGYRGTATLYALLAPPHWDRAQGHRIHGRGYWARLIGYTPAGRTRAIATARRATCASRKRRRGQRRCTPSFAPTSRPTRLQEGERDLDYTCRARPARRRESLTAGQCADTISITERLQREVWWLHGTCSRRAAYALRPLIRLGWTWQDLADELACWGVPPQLRDPVAYLHHEIVRRRRRGDLPPAGQLAASAPPVDDGLRHQAMLRERFQRHDPAWQRYTRHLRPALREQLAAAREDRRQQTATPPSYRPVLREDEDVFLASLPVQTWSDAPTPRQIYAARAHRRPPVRGRRTRESAPDWQRRLQDEAEAIRACEVLRVTLETTSVTAYPLHRSFWLPCHSVGGRTLLGPCSAAGCLGNRGECLRQCRRNT